MRFARRGAARRQLVFAAACGAAILLCTTPPALSQRVEITPLVGMRFGGSFSDSTTGESLELDEGVVYGLVVDVDVSEEAQLEVLYSRQESALQGGEMFAGAQLFDLTVEQWQIGGLVPMGGEDAGGFFVATVGVTRMAPAPAGYDDEIRFSFGVGGGAKWFPAKNVGLRAEGRVYVTFLSSSGTAFCGAGDYGGQCAITIDSDVIWQADVSAGVVFRF